MGSHLLDTVRYLLGDPQPRWVSGWITDLAPAAAGKDSPGIGLFQLEGGVHAYVNMEDARPAGFEIDVLGTEGRITIKANGLEPELWQGGSRTRGLTRHAFPHPHRPRAYGLTAVADITAAVEQSTRPRCSGEDGRTVLAMAVGLRHSAGQDGRRITFPLEGLGDAVIQSK